MSTAFKYGDNVNTDVILPGQYLNISDSATLALHAMEGIDPSFRNRVRPGDVLVAGKNFGCGSSREHAPMALKAAGIGVVLAASFARIFFRNAINIGLPVLECADAVLATADGDILDIDLTRGDIVNRSRGLVFKAAPLPPFIQEMISAGGLMQHIKNTLSSRGRLTNAM
ncbi:MAG TPA: 3-isopropylmalate dehydratase small subunit [Candidatus Methylomirabilis sp.]|nr:3-isopropylmalate dehydratase small subunit [Candidatus Methylomirabilis sp.]